jgi:hypothetical protein
MKSKLTYAAFIVPVVALIAMAAMFGKLGVRPRALSVIKPSGFADAEELGFWMARQTRQKLFRNELVFFGYDLEAPESFKVLEGFLETSHADGPGYDVLVSHLEQKFSNILNVTVPEKSTAEEVLAAAKPYLIGKKRVLVVLPTPQTSKIVKSSIARKFEFQLGQKSAAISVLRQSSSDISILREADYCANADKLSFEKAETLRCLFLSVAFKLDKEAEKSTKPVIAAVDQYGLDDYFIYLYSR